MGAAEGCGVALQASCLQGFDTLGLHQVMPWTVLRVGFEAKRRQVRFLLGAPSFVVLASKKHTWKVFEDQLSVKQEGVQLPTAHSGR